MTILLYLVPLALLLGLLGLGAFLWALRAGQYDDVEGAALQDEGARQSGHGVLGNGVRDLVEARHLGGDGTVVDDPPPARLLIRHAAKRLARTQEGAGGIDREHR